MSVAGGTEQAMASGSAALDACVHTTLHNGKLQLRQLQAGHRAGTDALLLAACIGNTGGVVLDLGAGAGAAGLSVALRNPASSLILAECEPKLAQVAAVNIGLNGLEGRARVVTVDALSAKSRAAAGLGGRCADVLVTNPPYQLAAASRVSPDPLKALAHTMAVRDDGAGGIDHWLRACAALLRPGGIFAMIHRADALDAILAASAGRFGNMQILPVHPKAGKPANRILLQAIAGSRAPLSIQPALVLHEDDGSFTPLAAAIHAGEAVLPL